MPEVYNSTDTTVKEADNGLRLNEGSKILLFLIVLLSNLFFLAYWSYKMAGEIRNTLRTNMGKLYLYLCLCGNKMRYEDEKFQREIEDENEILKEEFERQLNEIRKLWNPDPKIGKLVLNKVNIEKSALYLRPANYLKSIESRKKLTEEEIKEIKRNKRKAEGEKMHYNLAATLDVSDIVDNSVENISTKHQITMKSSNQFTDNLDKFL